MVQLSHPYMTTGKTIALIIWTFVSKVMSLFLNTLSRFIIAFLSLSKCLLISWLQSPSTVILEPSQFSSVQFSRSVMSDSLQPHEMQHARLPCPSPSLEVCPSSCPLHWWYYPAISSSDIFFSFCLQSFPASETFPMSQLFESDDQNTWVSASASVLPTRIQGWFPSRLTSLSSLLVQGTLRSLLQDHSLKTSILRCTTFFMVQLSQPQVTTWKTIALTIRTIVDRVKSLFCNTA